MAPYRSLRSSHSIWERHHVSDHLLFGIEGCGYKDQIGFFVAYHDDSGWSGCSSNFSKTYPSFLTLKEGSTSHPGPLSSGAREKTALLGARNRFALRLADHQRSSPCCAGWDRLGIWFMVC